MFKTLHRKKQKTLQLAIMALFLQQTIVFADPLELSLQDSVSLALKNNPTIQIANVDRQKSELGLDQAKAGRLPSLSLGSNYSVKDGNAADSSVSNSLRMSLPIYTGGKLEGQIDQAEKNVKAADLSVEKAKQQLVLDATTAYFNALETNNLANVNQEMVNNLQTHLNNVRAKYEVGVVAKSDVLRSEVELANAQQNLIKAQNNYEVAKSNLTNIIKVDNEDVRLKEELQYVAYGRTLEESLDLAEKNRPDIAQAELNVKVADTGVDIARSGKKPSVSASASTGWNDSLLPSDSNWSVGVSASWNIFDGNITNSQIKSAEASVDKAKLQAQQIKDDARQEVRQSYLGMKEAEKRLQTTEIAANKANEDLYIATEKYKAGAGTNLDVIDAQLALTQAKTNHIQALYDFNVNKAKLDKAIGLSGNE